MSTSAPDERFVSNPLCDSSLGSVVTSDYVTPLTKRKLHKKPREACKSSWNPRRSPKSIDTDNSLEFGKACEDLSGNHCTSTPHRSETNGIAERAVRRVKEGTSAVLLQPIIPFGSLVEYYPTTAKDQFRIHQFGKKV